MKKTLFVIFLITLLSQSVLGFIIYDTEIKDDFAYTNITLELRANNPVNYWTLEFTLPDNSEVVSISDSIGVITDYNQFSNKLKINTNKGPKKTRELLKIQIKTNRVVDHSFDPLKVVKLSYSGFENKNTIINIKSDEKIITSNIPHKFSIDKKDKHLSISGQGPVNVIFTMTDSGKDIGNYVVLGEGNLTKSQELNQIIPRMIGIVPYYNEFPVIILPDYKYKFELDGFSAGTYKTGGMIIIPESNSDTKDTTGIILHETVHAYNDQILRWSKTNVGWFDEGTASYVTWVGNELMGIKQPEIFGDPVEYYEGFMKYTIPSQGNREDLWDYYQNNEDFMTTWKSHDSSQSESTRRFGYAFSQLMIRHYIHENGPDALHELYRKLNEIDKEVKTPQEYNKILLDLMGSDMKPCYSTSKNRFNQCLDEINDMKASVPNTRIIEEEYGEVLDTEKMLNETRTAIEKENEKMTISKILFKITEFIDNTINKIKILINNLN